MSVKKESDYTIIHHHKPTRIRGIYSPSSDVIYIYYLIQNYDILYEYVKEHEIKHFKNYHDKYPYWIKILKDAVHEVRGQFKTRLHKKLCNQINLYEKKFNQINKDIKIYEKEEIYDLLILLDGEEPTDYQKKYFEDVEYMYKFLPIFIIITGIISINLFKFFFQWIL